MLGPARANALLLLGAQLLGFSSAAPGNQHVLGAPTPKHHSVDPVILAALDAHEDPVDALIAITPDVADQLATPRLLHVFGEKEPRWLTEGEKLRLRRNGKKFKDITNHEKFYAEQVNAKAGSARKSAIARVDIVPIQRVPSRPAYLHNALLTSPKIFPSCRTRALLSLCFLTSQQSACTTFSRK